MSSTKILQPKAQINFTIPEIITTDTTPPDTKTLKKNKLKYFNRDENDLNWLKGDVTRFDWNDDLISEDESNKRLIIIFFGISSVLMVVTNVLFFKYLGQFQVNYQYKWSEDIVGNLDESTGFPKQHLALVLQNGSVWDIKFRDNFMSFERKLLIQLPKSRPYHAFLTDLKTLNFVKNDLSLDIIQYHKNSRKQHSKVPRSSVTFKSEGFDQNYGKGEVYFQHGIQVGNKFWMLQAYMNGEFGKTGITRFIEFFLSE